MINNEILFASKFSKIEPPNYTPIKGSQVFTMVIEFQIEDDQIDENRYISKSKIMYQEFTAEQVCYKGGMDD